MAWMGNYAAWLRRIKLNLDISSDIHWFSVAFVRLISPEPNRVHRFIL